MNLLVLIQGRAVAASRYRILQYLPYMQEHGVFSEVREFPRTINEYLCLASDLSRFDAVFVQRKRFHFPFLPVFRKQARRVIFDLDDAVMFKNSLAEKTHSSTRMRRFANMARACDAVIAGNSFLVEQTQPYNQNVHLIPTSIPLGRYDVRAYGQQSGKVRIGWIGDHGSIHYLERRRAVFEEIGRRYPGQVELAIICDVFFDCEHIPVVKIPWSQANEVTELQCFDIGVMPLLDDLWSWGKCGLKILQYFGVGVPAVCTPVGVNRDVVHAGISGLWAMSDEQWVAALGHLIESPEERARMGLAGRRILEEGYTLEVNAPRMLEIIKG